MHYVYCMQRQETTTPKRLETPKGYQRVPDQCYSSLLLSTKATSLSFLLLLLASAPFPALASVTWDRISSMILPPYFSVFTFPMTFSSCMGFRQTDTVLHYYTCNCKHKQINSKHLTSASVVGFWQLRSEICSEDRTAWGNMLMPPLPDDDDSSLRSSSSLASRSLIQLRFAPLDNLPPPPLSWELSTAISSFTGLFPV